MNINHKYGWEQLHLAVRHLAASEGALGERLTTVVATRLVHVTPDRDLPEDIRSAFSKWMQEMQPSTVQQMGADRLRNAAAQLVDFYDSVCREAPQPLALTPKPSSGS
jgi:aspartate/methionine/tyrosine aminotransferase